MPRYYYEPPDALLKIKKKVAEVISRQYEEEQDSQEASVSDTVDMSSVVGMLDEAYNITVSIQNDVQNALVKSLSKNSNESRVEGVNTTNIEEMGKLYRSSQTILATFNPSSASDATVQILETRLQELDELRQDIMNSFPEIPDTLPTKQNRQGLEIPFNRAKYAEIARVKSLTTTAMNQLKQLTLILEKKLVQTGKSSGNLVGAGLYMSNAF